MNPITLLQVQLMPEQASNFAQEVDLLYIALIALTVFFTVAIAAIAAYFMVKYRRRRADENHGVVLRVPGARVADRHRAGGRSTGTGKTGPHLRRRRGRSRRPVPHRVRTRVRRSAGRSASRACVTRS